MFPEKSEKYRSGEVREDVVIKQNENHGQPPGLLLAAFCRQVMRVSDG